MNPPPALAFEAAVFDCDGTLVEMRELWRAAYEAVLGESVSDEAMSQLAGASTRIAAEKLGDIFGRTLSPFSIETALIEAASRHSLEPLDGAERLLAFLLQARLRLAIATNGPRAFIELVLGRRLGSFFEALVPSEELGPSKDKPAPGVYLEACARLGVEPEEAVAFEDAEIGARSALGAGLKLVFVNGQLDGPALGIAPHLFVKSLAEERLYEFLVRGTPASHAARPAT
jgi:HAD superfamily hydrolase (TIGR01509 family)